jgi:hypothetical protein
VDDDGPFRAAGDRVRRVSGDPPDATRLDRLRLHREVKGRYWAAFEERSPTEAKAKLAALAAAFAAAYPSFARSLEDDLDTLVVHLRFPYEHRKRIRSTNLLERTFVEVRRLARRHDDAEMVSEIERLRRALAAGEPLPELSSHEEVIARLEPVLL